MFNPAAYTDCTTLVQIMLGATEEHESLQMTVRMFAGKMLELPVFVTM